MPKKNRVKRHLPPWKRCQSKDSFSDSCKCFMLHETTPSITIRSPCSTCTYISRFFFNFSEKYRLNFIFISLARAKISPQLPELTQNHILTYIFHPPAPAGLYRDISSNRGLQSFGFRKTADEFVSWSWPRKGGETISTLLNGEQGSCHGNYCPWASSLDDTVCSGETDLLDCTRTTNAIAMQRIHVVICRGWGDKGSHVRFNNHSVEFGGKFPHPRRDRALL